MFRFSNISKDSVLEKVLRLPLRAVPKGLTVPVVQGPLRGARWIVGSGDHGYWLGSYEPATQSELWRAIRPGDVVYDLGANVGFYTLLGARRAGPSGTVISFEPDAGNVAYLQGHVRINGQKNCVIWQSAVGAKSEVGNYVRGQSAFTGRLSTNGQDGVPVEVFALDDMVRDGRIPPPNVIKCDVEHGEVEALRGAMFILTNYRLLVATHAPEKHTACRQILEGLGYRLSGLGSTAVEDSEEIVAEG